MTSPPPPLPVKAPTLRQRLQRGVARWSELLTRNSQIFLLGVVIACGVEVLSDWSSTFLEISLLRANVQRRATSYVSVLDKPMAAALVAGDWDEIRRLRDGVFDDEEAVYLRICDEQGKVLLEQLRPAFSGTFQPHRALYERLMQRDVLGLLRDPEGIVRRIADSHYRDVAQIWSDVLAGLRSRLSPPAATDGFRPLIVYDDRLRDENRNRDDKLSWATGALHYGGRSVGAVLVAFDMRQTNAAVRGKYLKGLGITAFFVALIVFQNLTGRRTKLRLLELNRRYAHAKLALREVLPRSELSLGELVVAGAVNQAPGPVDGVVYKFAECGGKLWLAVIDPDGEGIQTAVVGLHLARIFDARRAVGLDVPPQEELAALGAATRDVPLTRPLGVVLVVIEPTTHAYEAWWTEFASPYLVSDHGVQPCESLPVASCPEGLVGPLVRHRGELQPGETLLISAAGLGARQLRLDGGAVARYVQRNRRREAPLPLQDAALWARGKHRSFTDNDLVVVGVHRRPTPPPQERHAP